MTLSVTITPTGIIAPTYAEILDELKGDMRSIYGSDIYLEDDSQDGQMIAIFATAIKDSNDAIIAAYNSFSPATAQGVGLSSVVKINGIRRLSPSNSTVVVTIGGQAGIPINSGQISDPNTPNVRWALPVLVVIPDSGTIDVTATAVDPGTIQASPGTLTNIATPTRGWQTVTNGGAADPGLPVEGDATLRQRQSVSTAIPALSVLDATFGGIKNLPGVGRAFIYENDTDTTDANGIPSHSICAVVEGGDAQTIAETIALYKTPGTGTFGDVSEVVIDPKGIPSTIRFDSLTLVDIFVLVFGDAQTGYVSTTADLISESIAEFLNSLAIGGDSQITKLWSPVNLSGDAATSATGFTQAALDLLSDTYDANDIYQARTDMVITGGPYAATVVTVHITNPDNYAIGKKVALQLDNDTLLLTTVTNKVGNAITMANAIPTSRSAVNGALMYVEGNVIVDFNEAAAGDTANIDVEIT